MPTCHPNVMRNHNIKYTLKTVKVHRDDETVLHNNLIFLNTT